MSQSPRSIRYLILAAILVIVGLLGPVVANATAPEYADPTPAPAGGPGAGATWISSTGRYIAFAGPIDYAGDGRGGGYFLRDRQTQAVTRITALDTSHVSVTALDDSLRYAVVQTDLPLIAQDTNNAYDVYVLDRTTGAYELISQSTAGTLGDANSTVNTLRTMMSPDGRYVLFSSLAGNFAGSPMPSGISNVFLRDRTDQTTTLLSVTPSGEYGNNSSFGLALSRDGGTVAYLTYATNLVSVPAGNSGQIVVKDLATGTAIRASTPQGTADNGIFCNGADLSDDGNYVSISCVGPLLPGAGAEENVYRYDRQTGSLVQANVSASGPVLGGRTAGNSHISGDGKRILFSNTSHDTRLWTDADLISTVIASNTQESLLSRDGLVMAAKDLSQYPSRVGIWSLPTPSPSPTPTPTPSPTPVPVAAPTGLTAATPTNNAPVLTWDAQADVASFVIYRQDAASGATTGAGTSTTNTFTDAYMPGVYNYTVVAIDTNGTTSAPSSPFQVAVTNTTATTARNLTAQGQTEVIPVAALDLLPGLVSGNTTPATFDFSLGYPGGNFDVRRPLTVTFKAAGSSFFLASTSIDWLVIYGPGDSRGTFQGLADVTVGRSTTHGLPFTVRAVDGTNTNPVSPYFFQLTVYSDSARTAVLYSAQGDLSRGKVTIN